MSNLKAYRVEDLDADCGCSTVVFAESRTRAKVLAMSTDTCEDAEYVHIRATRIPELDGNYRGHNEMDWYNTDDRRALVKLGWYCFEPDRDDCATCQVKEDCENYQDYLEDEARWLQEEKQ